MSTHPFVRFCLFVGGLLTVTLLFALLELTKPADEINIGIDMGME